jgi:hypothetical protein
MKNVSLTLVMFAVLSTPSFARNSECADYGICEFKNNEKSSSQIIKGLEAIKGSKCENGGLARPGDGLCMFTGEDYPTYGTP